MLRGRERSDPLLQQRAVSFKRSPGGCCKNLHAKFGCAAARQPGLSRAAGRAWRLRLACARASGRVDSPISCVARSDARGERQLGVLAAAWSCAVVERGRLSARGRLVQACALGEAAAVELEHVRGLGRRRPTRRSAASKPAAAKAAQRAVVLERLAKTGFDDRTSAGRRRSRPWGGPKEVLHLLDSLYRTRASRRSVRLAELAGGAAAACGLWSSRSGGRGRAQVMLASRRVAGVCQQQFGPGGDRGGGEPRSSSAAIGSSSCASLASLLTLQAITIWSRLAIACAL